MTLRLRPDVYEALRQSAAESVRSMTSEINELLAEVLLKKEKASGSGLATSPDASE
ncbi:Arc family DNA-binding protein [Acetobacter sacchari]|uniref:Arc family DNA-binding protein n=1 Tax=Acetobacter sacchari TaxID=2661687 RepID=A0ABS3M0R0_9PROT|nr:Arc family DNA-binding protein [Acetobacter sacchari]